MNRPSSSFTAVSSMHRHFASCVFLLLAMPAPAADDLLVADFESDAYGAWTPTGEAFGTGPARGTLPNQMQVEGYEGERLVNSFFGGDGTTGTLTSPSFPIERKFINFLIGGGAHPQETCINLRVEGKIVRTATGPNDRPGGSERLDWASWEVEELLGQSAVIEIVDRHTGGWGHINIDHIVQSERRAASTPADRTRRIVLTGGYLLFPVSNSAPPCRLRLQVDGQLIQDFDINLADEKVDWWAHLDVSQHHGRTAVLTVDRLRGGSQGMKLISVAEQLRSVQPLYDEALRPQLRFSQQRGWNNDPNGMVYHAGEYHLFWQSNPFGPQWANMYWGHAISRDLVHWEELPLALTPRTMAVDKCFSGSANVDVEDTGGWRTGDEPVMVAAFTDTGCGEALAISRDRGRTWDYLDINPVIRHRGRDPKLIWYEPGRHWVIAVYSEDDDRKTIDFYTSRDLKRWERSSRLDGFFECPELVELPLDGDPASKRWVIFAADGQYLVGDFNGRDFIPDHTGKARVHYGAYYASQCFNRAPEDRVIQIGWAKIDMPGMPFNQGFSLPTELSLHSTADGPRLHVNPIRELNALRGEPRVAAGRSLSPESPLTLSVEGQLFDIVAEIEPRGAAEVALRFGENVVRYDVRDARLDEMPLPLVDGVLKLRVIVDRPMYEVVGADGAVYKTAARSDGGRSIDSIELSTRGGAAEVRSIQVFPMRSIWR